MLCWSWYVVFGVGMLCVELVCCVCSWYVVFGIGMLCLELVCCVWSWYVVFGVGMLCWSWYVVCQILHLSTVNVTSTLYGHCPI